MNTMQNISLLPEKTADGITKHEPDAARRALALRDLQRPQAATDALLACLLPHATPCRPRNNLLLPRPAAAEGYVYLIESGMFDILRVTDGLCVGVSEGPAIAGLQELLTTSPGRHSLLPAADARVSVLSASRARSLIGEQGLWEEVSLVIAFSLSVMHYREENMLCKSAYTVVKGKLIEYMAHRAFHVARNESIGAFIQRTTTLSRSLIYNMLSDLNEGGYITVNRGRLERIFYLPEAL